ncbi:hypothetical protein L226DRAFT_531238, partial [Lentinus tigrinus ALCF2SS1-7]|uniref:uncharacterized protein n=1 Tax=Lentinus tigrinus ALCF2SS1-7 TaxID=1328758 RepID=UPI0011660C65
ELEIAFKPSVAWRSPFEPPDVPPYVVKIVKESSQEVAIYELLQQCDRASPNHTVPCEVIYTDSRPPLLLMPCVGQYSLQFFPHWTTDQVADRFRQIAEGLEFLHDRRIVHLDLRLDNLLISQPKDVRYHEELELGKVYIVDFSESRLLHLEPGRQPAIDLPQSIIPKPLEMERLDPYSFDVYCLGIVLENTSQFVYKQRPTPWLLQRCAQWLIGNERGCTGVCRCRPTARRARQVLVVLQWAFRGLTLVESIFLSVRSVFSARKPPA